MARYATDYGNRHRAGGRRSGRTGRSTGGGYGQEFAYGQDYRTRSGGRVGRDLDQFGGLGERPGLRPSYHTHPRGELGHFRHANPRGWAEREGYGAGRRGLRERGYEGPYRTSGLGSPLGYGSSRSPWGFAGGAGRERWGRGYDRGFHYEPRR